MDEPINLVLFSGTDDQLQAAAVLAAGAAALGKPVNIFLQYWALDAFRADRISATMGSPPRPGRGREAVDALRGAGQASWAETLRQAKELGGVDIQACSLSMDLLRLERGRPRPARRRRRGRDRLLPQRRRGPARLHLIHPKGATNAMTVEIAVHRRREGAVLPDAHRRTAQAVKTLPPGALIEVLATDPGSVKDFAAWCRSTGNELVEQSIDGPSSASSSAGSEVTA